jgi:DNA-binding beta-propeller fold protein YncE
VCNDFLQIQLQEQQFSTVVLALISISFYRVSAVFIRSYVCWLYNLSLLVDAMSLDSSGNIYILDGLLARVTQWAQKGSTGVLVAGGASFASYYDYYFGTSDAMYYSGFYNYYFDYVDATSEPSGMFLDVQTLNIWIADTYNCEILTWTNPSTRIVVCGSCGSGSTQFDSPRGLYVDTSSGNTIYVADTDNHRIQMWVPGATSGVTVAGITTYYGTALNQLWSPQTLIVDTNGNMFIVDTGNDRIMRWTIGASSGMIIAGTGTSGTLASQFNNPYSISFDPYGSLFVSDWTNNRIQKFAISCRKDYLYFYKFHFYVSSVFIQ